MQLRTEVEIKAAPDRIWSVLTDLGSYPRWNPFLVQICGKLEIGSRLRICLSLLDGSELVLRPRVTVVVPERELRWVASRWSAKLLRIEHFFLLEPCGEGYSRLVQGHDLTGILAGHLGDRTTYLVRGMVHMNQALRQQVEPAGPVLGREGSIRSS